MTSLTLDKRSLHPQAPRSTGCRSRQARSAATLALSGKRRRHTARTAARQARLPGRRLAGLVALPGPITDYCFNPAATPAAPGPLASDPAPMRGDALVQNFEHRVTSPRNRSTVGHELALRPGFSSQARMPPTAQCATRRGAGVTGFDCGAGALLRRPLPSGPVGATNLAERSRVLALSLRRELSRGTKYLDAELTAGRLDYEESTACLDGEIRPQ